MGTRAPSGRTLLLHAPFYVEDQSRRIFDRGRGSPQRIPRRSRGYMERVEERVGANEMGCFEKCPYLDMDAFNRRETFCHGSDKRKGSCKGTIESVTHIQGKNVQAFHRLQYCSQSLLGSLTPQFVIPVSSTRTKISSWNNIYIQVNFRRVRLYVCYFQTIAKPCIVSTSAPYC